MTKQPSKWQRFMAQRLTKRERVIIVVVGLTIIAALMAIPPRPTTVGGWVLSALPAIVGAVSAHFGPRIREVLRTHDEADQ